MPELDPVTYDAIQNVIAEKSDKAEWDDDEMQAALLEVAKGKPQNQASEGRSVPQGTLSKKWNAVKEEIDRLNEKRERGAEMFRDPVEEALERFEDFFTELDEEFDMGINRTTIRMMKSEIRDRQALPAPMYVHRFLNNTASGVSKKQEIQWITRRYEQWLQRVRQDVPELQGPSGNQTMGGGYGQQIGGQNQPSYNSEFGMSFGGGGGPGGQFGQQPQQQPPQQPPSPQDDRIDRLERKLEELVESQQGGKQEEYSEHTIRVTMEDGKTVELPPDHPMAKELLDEDDGRNDFIETLRTMQEIGVIPQPGQQDSGDKMAEQISTAIQQLGQQQMNVQEQISENFQTVLNEIRAAQEEDEGALTRGDVQDILEDTLKEDEMSRLEKKMENMQKEFQRRLEDGRRAEIGQQDPEYLKKDREFQFREKQMEQINQQLSDLPEKMAVGVRQGLVPAIREMSNLSGGQSGGLWTPPTEDERGAPEYEPTGEPPSASERRSPEPQERQQPQRPAPEPQQPEQPQQQPQQRHQQEQAGGRPVGEADGGHGAGSEETMGQREPQSATESRARDIRNKLNLPN